MEVKKYFVIIISFFWLFLFVQISYAKESECLFDENLDFFHGNEQLFIDNCLFHDSVNQIYGCLNNKVASISIIDKGHYKIKSMKLDSGYRLDVIKANGQFKNLYSYFVYYTYMLYKNDQLIIELYTIIPNVIFKEVLEPDAIVRVHQNDGLFSEIAYFSKGEFKYKQK